MAQKEVLLNLVLQDTFEICFEIVKDSAAELFKVGMQSSTSD